MSNVETLQIHEPWSVSATVSIYNAMSNVDTLNAAAQRRRRSRKSERRIGGGGVGKRGVKLGETAGCEGEVCGQHFPVERNQKAAYVSLYADHCRGMSKGAGRVS